PPAPGPGGAGATAVPGLRRVAAGESDGIVALAGGAVATPALGGGRALHDRGHHRVLHRRVCAPAQAQARRGGPAGRAGLARSRGRALIEHRVNARAWERAPAPSPSPAGPASRRRAAPAGLAAI